MLRCNLSVLLAEQNLKITKVSNDTGISRTTLTSLSSNTSQGIQFDTLNTLCSYLKTTPEQLLSYISSDFSITSIDIKERDVFVSFNVKKNSICFNAVIDGLWLVVDKAEDKHTIMFDLIPYGDLSADTLQLIEVLRNLPRPFLSDLEAEIRRKFAMIVKGFPSVSISWNFNVI